MHTSSIMPSECVMVVVGCWGGGGGGERGGPFLIQQQPTGELMFVAEMTSRSAGNHTIHCGIHSLTAT